MRTPSSPYGRVTVDSVMQMQLKVVIYNRDGHVEIEAINAGVVGVGNTLEDAQADFEEAMTAVVRVALAKKLRITFEPDADDLAVFESITEAALASGALLKQGIRGRGTLNLNVRQQTQPALQPQRKPFWVYIGSSNAATNMAGLAAAEA